MSSEQAYIEYKDSVENYLEKRTFTKLVFSLFTILFLILLVNSAKKFVYKEDKSILNNSIDYQHLALLENNQLDLTVTQPASIQQNNLIASSRRSFLAQDNKKTLTIKSGDTLNKMLLQNGCTKSDVVKITKSLTLAKLQEKSLLSVGNKIELFYRPSDKANIEKIVLISKDLEKIEILSQKQNFIAKKIPVVFEKFAIKRSSKIFDGNLKKALLATGISKNQSQEILSSFKQQLNLDKFLTNSSTIHVILEKNIAKESGKVNYGNILFVSLNDGSKTHNIYRYDAGFGSSQYFSEQGKVLKATLLKFPVKGVPKISSKFGMRTIGSGYRKMHFGVDFKAPIGSEILSAGDGVVTKTTWGNGYGRYIEIKHSKDYSTLYAHLNKFAKGISVGTKIKQGQVIGSVGMTGRTTGPHIHLELKHKGQRVDFLHHSAQIKHELNSKKLKEFTSFKNSLLALNSKFNGDNITEIALNKTLVKNKN